MDDSENRVERDRISRLFQFVRALNELRNPVPRQIRELQWSLPLVDLPHHECVILGAPTSTSNDDEGDDGDDFILRVKRPPPLEPVPSPPPEIADWIEDGWQKYEGSVSVRETRPKLGSTSQAETERFGEDASRVLALARWTALRVSFIAENMPALGAFRLFERLYELHGALERDAERYDVMLGDGILCWSVPKGSIRFPIVLQKLELEFNPSVPSFTLTDAASPTELYSTLFRTIDTVDGSVVGAIKKELDAGQYHPWSADDLTALLRSIPPRLAANGRYLDEAPAREPSEPSIYRAPIIFLRKRTLGIAEALEKIIADIAADGALPQSLINIVGEGTLAPNSTLGEPSDTSSEAEDQRDVLFTKPANVEQYRIAEALAHHACVLVQGPPGTGKTHTIANLLGHLLAEGKSVLVTSSTTKALRVLREKVVEQLRPLCVSVLESDSQSNDQLKAAVDSIVERLSSATESGLQNQVDRLTHERKSLLADVSGTRQRLLQGRSQDSQPVQVGTDSYDALEAARTVANGRNDHSWIPMPIVGGSALTVTSEEIRSLYRTNATVPLAVEGELAQLLPNPDELLRPSELAAAIQEISQIDAAEKTGLRYWEVDNLDASSQTAVQGLMSALPAIIHPWLEAEDWLFAVGYDGFRGGGHLEAWTALFRSVRELEELCAESRESLVRYGPMLDQGVDVDEQRECLKDVLLHLQAGGNLKFLALLLKPKWKNLLAKVKVNGRSPQSAEEIKALYLLASIECERASLRTRWQRQVGEIGGPVLPNARPEETAVHLIKSIQAALEWSERDLKPIRNGIVAQGFDWSKALSDLLVANEHQAEFRANVRLCSDVIPGALDARLKQFLVRQHTAALDDLQSALSRFSGETNDRLLTAVRTRSSEMYDAAFKSLRALFVSMEELRLRRDILGRLSQIAPAWADAIAKRLAPHDRETPPGDVRSAWLWAQLAQQLEDRDKISIDDLQRGLHSKVELLQQKTAQLADACAWLAQRRRTGLAEQQALTGWQQAIKRIGKGTGKRVPTLRKHARELMDRAKTAVPVWIMPMIRVAENYDPQTTRFDVVIIDEASQSDVTGLMALYYGRQVVVVGDDEQVSPEAVGQRIDETQHLIDEYLYGIPNDQLYDGKSSIYDLAKQAFGGTICLREHFRCVPDIIQFSNHLSYDDKLIPLREASESTLLPHVVAHHVPGTASNKVNDEEVEEIVALVMSCLEQPEYDGKTFGVISLVGEEQAAAIETRLRRLVEPKVLEERRLLCGNSAHFQGDERDVIFLSMVDSSSGIPLKMRDDSMFKKRFNVAASRARDQMWVVHSLDIADLQARDLRRRLIEHALNPKALQVKIDTKLSKAESEFEKDVLRRLITAGYLVKPQYIIGPYRIDIMVEGRSRRLAVECDGEQFHTILDLQHDMERQSQLERVGLTFYRIRGSRYYRDREREFQNLLDRLSEMGIGPDRTEIDPVVDVGELLQRVLFRAAQIRKESSDDHDIDFYRKQWSTSSRVIVDDLKPVTKLGMPHGGGSHADGVAGDEGADTTRLSERISPEAGVDSRISVLDDNANVSSTNGERCTRKREHHEAKEIADRVIDLLLRSGVERSDVIDKRDHERGSLWVIADESQRDLFESLARRGVRFTFAPEGGRATGHRPAWWMRHNEE
ncbi:MAG TPA: AAA domain-containing protein [Candidatus Baltobacteraceae bacterium]|nr:AAA domain-containing protein [Candidatus Baltobacteraceae bacterium]